MTTLPVPTAGQTITAGYAPGQSGKAIFNPNTDQLLPGADKVGGLSDNQIHGILNNQLGRDATPYELSIYKTAPIQTLANLKQTYANFNTNSLAGYLQSIGQDSSPQALQTLGQKYGINAGTPDGNTQLLNVLKNGTQPTPPTVSGTVAGATPSLYDPQTGYLTTYGVTSGAPVVKLGDPGDGSGDKTGINYSGVDATGNGMGATPQDAVNTPGISGSVSGATGISTPPTPDGTVDNDPDVWNATQTYNQYLTAYQTAQKAVASIDAQINTLRESQQAARGEFLANAAKSGGVVTSAQENAELAVQNRDINEQINSLLDQRAPYATEQSEASTALNQAREQLNSARSDFYKSANLTNSEQKTAITEQQNAQKINISLQKMGLSQDNTVAKAILSGIADGSLHYSTAQLNAFDKAFSLPTGTFSGETTKLTSPTESLDASILAETANDPNWSLFTDDQKQAYIRSLGGDPSKINYK